jgi:HD-GYP domain-containing protein (c-di-GMP phosphodiesterase class II)/putative methionine-R-sulfoxide reductase with GAF domain
MLLLQSLAGALARARSESDVAWAVVDELRTLIDYHACRFYLLSPTGERLLPIAHSGSGSAEGRGGELLECAVGEGVTGRALVDGLSRRIANARLDPAAVAIPGTGQVDESMLVAPMRIDGDPIGVIVLTKLGADRFDDRDLRLLEVIASTAAVGHENARLYAESREQAYVAQALLDLGMALSIQASVEDVARMVASAVDRLLESAALSVWLRDGDCLHLAAQAGYTPEEGERLEGARLRAGDPPFADALDRRLVTVRGVAEGAGLVACLDHAPAGSTFAIAAIGERAGNRGAIVVQRGPRRGVPSFRDEQLLLGIADQALLAITNRALYAELEQSFLATMQALANALETKDEYTGDHAQALIGLASRVAERLGISGTPLRDISFAAALHDVGKIGIPAEILNKPSALSPEEWEVMRLHPELGARILEPVPALAGARELVLACHEHWDGTGYPLGLAGASIPLGARIILACDAFHAMTSDRVYRAALGLDEALAELRQCAGSHFDPDVARALIATVGEEAGGSPAG